MSSSQTQGLEGHQWRLHRTSGNRLPCRAVCECGWTSAAGPDTAVLLELKGHLEDSLHDGARVPAPGRGTCTQTISHPAAGAPAASPDPEPWPGPG